MVTSALVLGMKGDVYNFFTTNWSLSKNILNSGNRLTPISSIESIHHTLAKFFYRLNWYRNGTTAGPGLLEVIWVGHA
jgi:hypothetical protein